MTRPILYYSNEQSFKLFKKQKEKELDNELKQLQQNEAARYNEIFNEREIDIISNLYKNTMEKVEKLKKEPAMLSIEQNIKKLIKEKQRLALPASSSDIQTLLLALPESERSKMLTLPASSTPASSTPANLIVPFEVKQKIESEQEGKPKGGTPTASSKSPISQLAEDASLRVQLKDNELYKNFRALPRANRGGFPTQDEMRKFVIENNLSVILPEKAGSAILADLIIREIASKKVSGQGIAKKKVSRQGIRKK